MGIYIDGAKMPESKRIGEEYLIWGDGEVKHDGLYFQHKAIDLDLVTCDKCVHWIDGYYCLLYDRTAEPSDFCSFGERRHDNV